MRHLFDGGLPDQDRLHVDRRHRRRRRPREPRSTCRARPRSSSTSPAGNDHTAITHDSRALQVGATRARAEAAALHVGASRASAARSSRSSSAARRATSARSATADPREEPVDERHDPDPRVSRRSGHPRRSRRTGGVPASIAGLVVAAASSPVPCSAAATTPRIRRRAVARHVARTRPARTPSVGPRRAGRSRFGGEPIGSRRRRARRDRDARTSEVQSHRPADGSSGGTRRSVDVGGRASGASRDRRRRSWRCATSAGCRASSTAPTARRAGRPRSPARRRPGAPARRARGHARRRAAGARAATTERHGHARPAFDAGSGAVRWSTRGRRVRRHRPADRRRTADAVVDLARRRRPRQRPARSTWRPARPAGRSPPGRRPRPPRSPATAGRRGARATGTHSARIRALDAGDGHAALGRRRSRRRSSRRPSPLADGDDYVRGRPLRHRHRRSTSATGAIRWRAGPTTGRRSTRRPVLAGDAMACPRLPTTSSWSLDRATGRGPRRAPTPRRGHRRRDRRAVGVRRRWPRPAGRIEAPSDR